MEQQVRSQRRATAIVSALLLVLASITCMHVMAQVEGAKQAAVRLF